METITIPSEGVEKSAINWKVMGSLVALYASIIIGWIAYEQYQPRLLVQFGFTEFAGALAIAQGFILTLTPPIAGKLGDKFRISRGHRFPVISLGINFAAMVFMAVAFTLIGNPGEVLKWALPVLIILWLVAMSIFTSPALSTIETFIPIEKLPRAMAILTITANLLYSLEPVIVDIIDYLGAPVTFIAGGVFVFLAGLALKRNAFAFLKQRGGDTVKETTSASQVRHTSAYGFIFLMGAILGVVTALLFHMFPEILAVSLTDMLGESDSKVVVVGVLIVSGILSLPFSTLVNRYGLRRSFLISVGVCAVAIASLFLFSFSPIVLVTLLVFAIGYAALSVCSLPLAMEKSGFYEKVMCVGIFFAGVALPDAIFEVLEVM